MNPNFSESEESGIGLVPPDAVDILSVGISTGGIAEIRMARNHAARHIIATTIDEKGARFAEEHIAAKHLQSQIQVKVEDVAQPLPYEDNTFDYIYARLVLHYLSKQELDNSLAELNRVLKRGKMLFIVVRSDQTPDALAENATYDAETGMTTNTSTDANGTVERYSRYFHSEASIQEHCTDAGFQVQSVRTYDEKLFKDFMRTVPADHTDNVIELIAVK